jgi:hypothetical protein
VFGSELKVAIIIRQNLDKSSTMPNAARMNEDELVLSEVFETGWRVSQDQSSSKAPFGEQALNTENATSLELKIKSKAILGS